MKLATWLTTLLMATLGAACVPEYRPPTLSEPHALIKIRRTYDTAGGVKLRELLLVDDHSALRDEVPAQLAGSPRIDVTLVHPIPATFVMKSRFFHLESRLVDETYYEQESYQDTESYSCGSGTSYQSCTRSVTRYRSVPRHRMVTKLVEVTNAECEAQRRFAPATDKVYLLQYSFQENRACSMSCFEQVPNSDGSFQNLPCPAAPPE
jgi:hypothetical protein